MKTFNSFNLRNFISIENIFNDISLSIDDPTLFHNIDGLLSFKDKYGRNVALLEDLFLCCGTLTILDCMTLKCHNKSHKMNLELTCE